MGRHSASYLARRQALRTGDTGPLDTVVHIGRVGLLAVALGIGVAAFSGTAVADAEVTSSNTGAAAAAEPSPRSPTDDTPKTGPSADGRDGGDGGEGDGAEGDEHGATDGDNDLGDELGDDLSGDLGGGGTEPDATGPNNAGLGDAEPGDTATDDIEKGDTTPVAAELLTASLNLETQQTARRDNRLAENTSAAPQIALPEPDDQAATEYGDIGKWMLERNGDIADYGGLPYDGKTVLEPVNVIFVDQTSRSALEATWRLSVAMRRAGFPPRFFHSTGFRGLIDDVRYRQRPGGLLLGYSDNFFLLPNNHGRIFGPDPVETSAGYVWSGAFSTEEFTFYQGLPRHGYVSSNEARDALAADFVASGRGSLGGMVSLDNIYDSDDLTTGDHDGYAVVIVLASPGAATTVAVLVNRGSSEVGRCDAAPLAAAAGCPADTAAFPPGISDWTGTVVTPIDSQSGGGGI